MNKTLVGFAFACSAFALPQAAFSESTVTKDDAVAMVKQVTQYLKTNGKEKTFAEINNPKGQFVKGELYMVATGLDGVVLAHGANEKLVGKNIFGIKDADGKLFVQEQITLAKTKGSGWMDFRWPNPVTKAIEPKTVYVQRYEDFLLAGGIYKK